MGALFENLHDVGQVLSEHIQEETGIQDVQPGAPREVSATPNAGARITLLYSTPQPGHRNDRAEPRPEGGLRRPPLSISCFYLVTTSGVDADDPVAAHHALGRIMTLYHDVPTLRLPLSAQPTSPPGVYTELGEGELTVSQVPITLDQIDKVWTPLTQQLQPWVLFEVAPVQLVSPVPRDSPGDGRLAPMVRPGGIVLGALVGERPAVLRVTPSPVRTGGRVRVEIATSAEVDGVRVGSVAVPAGDPALTVHPGEDGTHPVAVLDLGSGGLDGLATGRYPLTVAAAGLVSRAETLVLQDGGTGLDAPAAAAPHDRTKDLLLTGIGLDAVQEVVIWPDSGLAAPSQVHSLPFAPGGSGALTVRSAGGLATLPTAIATWRLSARLAGQDYTPFVVLGLR